MGRNFHGDGFRPTLLQIIQGRLHGNRIWRGQATALQLAIETRAQGADQATALTEFVQSLSHQLSDAGLAVGTSDTDQIQLTARLAIKAPGNI
ncbi:hypothetical protein D3C75_1068870 [compost metagenome]